MLYNVYIRLFPQHICLFKQGIYLKISATFVEIYIYYIIKIGIHYKYIYMK